MASLRYYFENTIIRPRRAFSELLSDPRRLKHGFITFLIMVLLYTVGILFIAFSGAEPTMRPWLAIPSKNYYYWQTLFYAPVFITGWILAAGVVQLLSRLFKGNGTFEDTASLLGFGIAVPTYVTLIPDTIGGFLAFLGIINQKEYTEFITHPGLGQIFSWSLMLIELVWLITLFSVSVEKAQKLPWWKAGIIGTIGYIVYQLFLFIFIR